MLSRLELNPGDGCVLQADGYSLACLDPIPVAMDVARWRPSWLDRAVVERDGGLAEVKYQPLLRLVRADPP